MTGLNIFADAERMEAGCVRWFFYMFFIYFFSFLGIVYSINGGGCSEGFGGSSVDA